MEVEKKLKEDDIAISMASPRQKGLGASDLRFVFEPGDQVLMCQKRPGKI